MSSKQSLESRVALVTGAARRVGAEIATQLHAAGADVAIHYRHSADDADDLVARLNALRPDSAASFQADLLDTAALPGLVAEVTGWHGTEKKWDDLVGSNFKAPLFLAQAAADSLRERRGTIVNIVDIHAQRPLRNHLVYSPAKAGLAMLTRALAKELAPDVRVNGVSPGAILWPEGDMSDATKASILDEVPLARPGDPADIAGCVLYLVRDATYVTGQIVAVDGGRSIGW